MLEVLFENEHIIAINKPHGLAVHKSKLVRNTTVFALQLLRDQIGHYVSPIHRIDRKTSGVLVFSKTQSETAIIQKELQKSQKLYLAIVRGFTPKSGIIQKALVNDHGVLQEAETTYKTLEYSEIKIAYGNHSTSRYSLLCIEPLTGRKHQIRRHFNHLRHPIIGDRPHGCNKQNRFFLNTWNMNTMLLHAKELVMHNPYSNQPLRISAPLSSEFKRMLVSLNFKTDLLNL